MRQEHRCAIALRQHSAMRTGNLSEIGRLRQLRVEPIDLERAAAGRAAAAVDCQGLFAATENIARHISAVAPK
jgi:hypothetical protein